MLRIGPGKSLSKGAVPGWDAVSGTTCRRSLAVQSLPSDCNFHVAESQGEASDGRGRQEVFVVARHLTSAGAAQVNSQSLPRNWRRPSVSLAVSSARGSREGFKPAAESVNACFR